MPGYVNILADVMSRAIATNSSCFLQKEHPISKKFAHNIPPIKDTFCVSREALFKFLTEPLKPEPQDLYNREQRRLMEPRTVQEFFDLTKEISEEECYNNALKQLRRWDSDYNERNSIYADNMKVRNAKLTIDVKKQQEYLLKIEEVMEKHYEKKGESYF